MTTPAPLPRRRDAMSTATFRPGELSTRYSGAALWSIRMMTALDHSVRTNQGSRDERDDHHHPHVAHD